MRGIFRAFALQGDPLFISHDVKGVGSVRHRGRAQTDPAAAVKKVIDGLAGKMTKLPVRIKGEETIDLFAKDSAGLDHGIVVGINFFSFRFNTAVIALTREKRKLAVDIAVRLFCISALIFRSFESNFAKDGDDRTGAGLLDVETLNSAGRSTEEKIRFFDSGDKGLSEEGIEPGGSIRHHRGIVKRRHEGSKGSIKKREEKSEFMGRVGI